MTFKKSITALFSLSLSVSVLAETPSSTTPEKSFVDTLSDKGVMFSAGSQANTLEGAYSDLEFDGTYLSASFKPTKEFKISTSYFTSETETLAEYSIQELWFGLPVGDDDVLLDAFGLDYYANGWGRTFDDNGDVDRYFNNGYFVLTSIEMNEFEVGVSYVLDLGGAWNYDFYLGYISGELVTNENLSNKLVFSDDLSEIPATLANYIKRNDFNVEGFFDEGLDTEEEYKGQDYLAQYGYVYTVYPNDNVNAHGVSSSIGYSTFVMKIEADFAVTDNFHLKAGLASESTTMDNVDEDLQDNVYNLGALYTIWNGIGVEFNHKIYDGQTKTSVGVNYAF